MEFLITRTPCKGIKYHIWWPGYHMHISQEFCDLLHGLFGEEKEIRIFNNQCFPFLDEYEFEYVKEYHDGVCLMHTVLYEGKEYQVCDWWLSKAYGRAFKQGSKFSIWKI